MEFQAMPRYQMRRNAVSKLLKDDMRRWKERGGVNPNCILEIGYGAGDIFSLYQKLGLRAEGFDSSETAYQYAIGHSQAYGALLHSRMPKPEKRFDYVAACEVLEHIKDDVSALRQWKAYLKDSGKMIVSVPAHQSRWGENDIYSGHYRRYERRELIQKFAQAGMRVEKIYTYDFPACLLLDVMRDKSRKKKLSGQRKSREEYTKNSGVERDFHPLVLAMSHPALWLPACKLGELFYRTDFGSAYILLASQRRIIGKA